MFNKELYKKLSLKLEMMERYDLVSDLTISMKRRELTDLFVKSYKNLDDFIEYMYSDMTESEYSTLWEISDEIANERPSWEFIEAYKFLVQKYPHDTKRFNINDFIENAESIIRYHLGENTSIFQEKECKLKNNLSKKKKYFYPNNLNPILYPPKIK